MIQSMSVSIQYLRTGFHQLLHDKSPNKPKELQVGMWLVANWICNNPQSCLWTSPYPSCKSLASELSWPNDPFGSLGNSLGNSATVPPSIGQPFTPFRKYFIAWATNGPAKPTRSPSPKSLDLGRDWWPSPNGQPNFSTPKFSARRPRQQWLALHFPRAALIPGWTHRWADCSMDTEVASGGIPAKRRNPIYRSICIILEKMWSAAYQRWLSLQYPHTISQNPHEIPWNPNSPTRCSRASVPRWLLGRPPCTPLRWQPYSRCTSASQAPRVKFWDSMGSNARISWNFMGDFMECHGIEMLNYVKLCWI